MGKGENNVTSYLSLMYLIFSYMHNRSLVPGKPKLKKWFQVGEWVLGR